MKDTSAQSQVNKFVHFALISLFLAGFICLLNYYGYALLPFWPDETFFLQPAQNLAEGNENRERKLLLSHR